MKRSISFKIILLLLVFSFTACKKYLDQVPDDKETIDDVFKTRAETEKYLAGVYNYIKKNGDWNNMSPWEGLSDEIDITYNDYSTYSMNLGQWDRNRESYNFWKEYYQGIRTASYFMKRAPECKDLGPVLLKQYIAEARVLRAWFYANLLAQYGPVIILPNSPISPDATIKDFSLPRNSYDECVNYITGQLDSALTDLPAAQDPNDSRNYGRIKKGVALAIKSRALLYAASPLFNGNSDYADFKNKDGKVLINQSYDVNKWKKAADAAKALIDMPNYSLYKEYDGSGKIDPYKSLRNLFLKDWNSEIIMSRVGDMYLHDKCAAPVILGGWSAWGPTQQAVDAYFMANGRSIDDPNSGYSESGFTNNNTPYYSAGASNMYVGREPRFYVAVTFNLSKWINNASNDNGGTANSPITIQLYKNGNSGQYTGRNWSRTGYVVRKWSNPSSIVGPDRIADRSEMIFRLGEIYLNYAEALNEYNPGNADIKKYINLIRERAGIPQYGSEGLAEPGNQNAWREAIHKERRVELAFEYHRYFDTRRWKIASQTDGGPFYGMDVNANNTTDFSKRTVFETRVFLPKNYLWNIIQGELNRDVNLVENPGW